MTEHTWLDEHDSLNLSARLKGDWGGWACPCGNDRYIGQSRAAHAKWHLDWAEGIRLNDRQQTVAICADFQSDTLLVVSQNGPAPLRRLAYDLALIFRREQSYDFPMLPAPGYVWEDEPTAYLAIFNRRAIGLVILHDIPRWGYYVARNAGDRIPLDHIETVRAIAGIFVCGNYRRHGVGSELVRAACAREELAVDNVPWGLPFSDAGRALAGSLVAKELLRVN